MALLNAQSDDLDILEFFHDVADAAADALDEVLYQINLIEDARRVGD